MVQDIKHYNPGSPNNKQLSDDWRIICSWYATASDLEKKFKFPMNEIIDVAKKIYLEILRRVDAREMVHEFKPDEMTDSSRQLFEFLKSETGRQVKEKTNEREVIHNFIKIGKGDVSERGSVIELRDLIEPLQGKEFMVMEDAVTLVGSLANYNKTDGDVDLLLKNPNDLASVVRFRIERFPQLAEIKKRIQFITDDSRGPFTNHVHMADLIIRFKNVMQTHQMSDDASTPDEANEENGIEENILEDFRRECITSSAKDEIIPGRAFYQQKPIHGRQIGEAYNIDSTIEILNNQWKDWKTKGVYVSRKYDGTTNQIHIREDHGTIKIQSEDGSDITKNLPTIAAEFINKKLEDTVIIGEIELWKDGKHQARAISSAVCSHYNKELEPFMQITIYDMFYYGKLEDIHNKPYSFRREEYLKIEETPHIKVSKEETLCKNESGLRELIKYYSGKAGSEGAMIKNATSPYKLKIHPTDPGMIKFKRERQVTARVVGVEPVEGANAWVYVIGVDEKETIISKTYVSSIKANVKDLIEVSFVDISKYIDPSTKKTYYNLWAPHVTKLILKADGKTTTPLKELDKMVMETTGRVEEKKMPKKFFDYTPEGTKPKPAKNEKYAAQETSIGEENKNTEEVTKWKKYVQGKSWPEESEENYGFAVTWAGGRALATYKYKDDAIAFISQGDREVVAVSYGERKEGAKIRKKFLPDPCNKIKNAATLKYVIQTHIRGGTAHFDFRYENDAGSLDGFTFLVQKKKEFQDKLKWTLKKNELLWDSKSYFKFNGDEVTEKPSKALEQEVFNFHKKLIEDESLWKININTGDELEREESKRQILCVKKSKEPHSWLNVEGITLPREIMEDPGGTRFYPGIFITLDKGTLEKGASKPYYEELFLQGKKWKGRVIFREHHLDEEGANFQWLYEKTKDDTPYVIDKRAIKLGWLPKGYSALPSKMEYLVPPTLNYWKPGLTAAERLQRRKELAKFFEEKNKKSANVKPNSLIEPKGIKDKFIYTRRIWHGQKVVRDLPQLTYYMKLGAGKAKKFFRIEDDIIKQTSSATELEFNPEFIIPGEKQPNTPANPNKEIPAFIELLDSGNFDVLSESNILITVKFEGSYLKETFTFKRSDPTASIWVIERSKSLKV